MFKIKLRSQKDMREICLYKQIIKHPLVPKKLFYNIIFTCCSGTKIVFPKKNGEEITIHSGISPLFKFIPIKTTPFI